ncbi:MAG: DNA-directed RNA polymerase sigma-70 factor [Saprospiraceae bacterium]|nr:MAG: DNA-directed RNA polymerase sigma-70 factor [Saprospiraceae bacterium]
MAKKSEQLVEHLFRTEYGKLVATMTRIFGTSHIQLAEDIVQETLISALDHWSIEGIPSNPVGWLVQVAKRKALNELKRNKMMQKHHQSGGLSQDPSYQIGAVFLQDEIKDSQLRMIFTCCHPSLNVESQIALTLKTLCGFGIREVANALLTTESTINKRLYRAKASIRESNLPFCIPQGKELESRLESVSLTLYLLFNEGYNATIGGTLIQKELCLEAVRLTKLLVDYFEENQKLCALLSLMCFHTARFEARLDDHGAIVLFEDQNRMLWNKELINIGMLYLKKSMHGQSLSAYHIEASIGAEHCLAESFETTNWQNIYNYYKLLGKLKPNPIIQLNLAIIQSKLEGIETSLTSLNKLTKNKALKNYHLLPATQGIFNMKLGNYKKAIAYLHEAQKLRPSLTENKFIEEKILECNTLLSTSS